MQKSKLITRDFSKCQGKISNVLYQQVISKNFQVIQKFLLKFNTIHTKQQQLQQLVRQTSQRMTKLQSDSSNLHHQFRTINFVIDNKIAQMKNQLRVFFQFNCNRNTTQRKSKRISRTGLKVKNKSNNKFLFEKRKNRGIKSRKTLIYTETGKQRQIQSKNSLNQSFTSQLRRLNQLNQNGKDTSESQFSQSQNSLQICQFIQKIQNMVKNQILKAKDQLVERIQKLSQQAEKDNGKISQRIKDIDLNIQQISTNYVSKKDAKQDYRKTLNTADTMINDRINITKDELMLVLHSSLEKGLNQIRKGIKLHQMKISYCETAAQKSILGLAKANNQIEQIKQKILKTQEERRQIYADRQQTKNAFIFIQKKINTFIQSIIKQVKSAAKRTSNNLNQVDRTNSDSHLVKQFFNKDRVQKAFSRRRTALNCNLSEFSKTANLSSIEKQLDINYEQNIDSYDAENLEKIYIQKINEIKMDVCRQRPFSNSKTRQQRIASVSSLNINSKNLQNQSNSQFTNSNKAANLNMWKKRTNQILQKSNKKKIF